MKLLEVKKIVLIGASTGGPGQIQKIIKALPKLQNTTIIIAQHMVNGFMNSFVSRLQNSSQNSISLIQNNQTLENNFIYLCEGETSLNIDSNKLFFSKKESAHNSYNPNIDILFNSFIPLCKDLEMMGVILTGIGDDGVAGCKDLNLNGARCVTESAESAIVDGMPSRARLLVPNIEIENIDKIVKKISVFCDV
ncbi:MAG: chemotaxis protein CheB [Campylobacterota bacterium]|nr:chemotaxis protein CheB [Campylobacterota bacterium]